MSVFRQDPTTKDWVIIADERQRRPDEFKQSPSPHPPLSFEPACPFCPGHEDQTPPELLRFGNSSGSSWQVRVFPNKFSAVRGHGPATRREEGPLFREMVGVGSHEVIVETPRHNEYTSLMESSHIGQILQAFQARYQILMEDPQIKYICLFKNHGSRAGTSLEHPHCQLVATPVAPLLIRKKYEIAMAHYDETGRCLYSDILDQERANGSRLLFESQHFVVFHPFASRLPYETWIVPIHRESSFGHIQPEELVDLATVLKITLYSLYQGLGNPDFNFIIHSSPTDDATKDYFLWHIQILPRTTTIAGFELGSGIFINSMLPEDSAAYLRQYCHKDLTSPHAHPCH